MKNRKRTPLASLFMLFATTMSIMTMTTACGAESHGNVLGTVGWTFDYRNWTKSTSEPDVRVCDNVPASGVATPAYSAIDHVRVTLRDELGQIKGIETDAPCSVSLGSADYDLYGVDVREWVFSLEGMTADDVVMYRYDDAEMDLNTPVNETFELLAAVGEIDFFVGFGSSDALTCPTNVQTLKWELFELIDGVVSTTPNTVGTRDACPDSYPDEVIIRQIPSTPVQGPTGGYAPTNYKLRLQALDAGGTTTYCSVTSRAINPGDDNIGGNVIVYAAECPTL